MCYPHTHPHRSCKSKIATLCHPIFLYLYFILLNPVVIVYCVIGTEIPSKSIRMNNRVNRKIIILSRETR